MDYTDDELLFDDRLEASEGRGDWGTGPLAASGHDKRPFAPHSEISGRDEKKNEEVLLSRRFYG
jgi:hypothetical protein